jgi:hypothetical protein
MSRLSVFWPEESKSISAGTDDRMVIPFPQSRGVHDKPFQAMDVVTRARLMFSNRKCRDCGYPVVQPIELSDSAMNLNGRAIPGTATLIGFRCCGCHTEWSV